jgi:hypothetical protein
MPHKLRVYGWEGFRTGARNGTREIVAARSQAEAARRAGVGAPRNLFNLCETGNRDEIAEALAQPGTVLWKPIGESWHPEFPWRK